jgi:hypothetical protein
LSDNSTTTALTLIRQVAGSGVVVTNAGSFTRKPFSAYGPLMLNVTELISAPEVSSIPKNIADPGTRLQVPGIEKVPSSDPLPSNAWIVTVYGASVFA